MFESPVVEVADTVALADRLDASVVEQLRLEAERFALVAAWADQHPVLDAGEVDPSWSAYRRRSSTRPAGGASSYGAEGTPAVSEFAVEELGCLLRTTTGSAGRLLRDVLDLRHRLPAHWAAVMTGRLEGWKARKVARLTEELSLRQCREVDGSTVAGSIGLPFGRAQAAVEAAVIAVDPVADEQRRSLEAERRYVGTGRPSDRFGLRTMFVRADAGVIARFAAMLAHVAELLAAAGDPDPVQVRRAKAFGILANPALACVFLAHAHPTHPSQGASTSAATSAEPEPDPEGEPSAVELAGRFGRVLAELGTTVVDRLRPRMVMYVHLAQEAVQGVAGAQVARVEGIGPVGVEQLRTWLGTDQVVVRPVLDPAGQPSSDGYEVRGDLREAVQLLHPVEVFPWGTLGSRTADIDHTVPYVSPDEGGPPGQTRVGNLGPLGRRHHRAKTVGGFVCHQPLPGMFLWQTPTGHWYQVDHHGTHQLGRHTPMILRQQHGPPRTSRIDAHFADIILAA